ncbi:unnamed protein product [Notodromas monacha]|uniref:Pro-resilin n=1 Tax=Notodromas monacha TaxID=399045 RepID=A0A7R9GFY9_9CRUS|nr:unnamed protein product [Notodromas monacha]CAG0921287.1 unnamed protein product [Notodromas monacha]
MAIRSLLALAVLSSIAIANALPQQYYFVRGNAERREDTGEKSAEVSVEAPEPRRTVYASRPRERYQQASHSDEYDDGFSYRVRAHGGKSYGGGYKSGSGENNKSYGGGHSGSAEFGHSETRKQFYLFFILEGPSTFRLFSYRVRAHGGKSYGGGYKSGSGENNKSYGGGHSGSAEFGHSETRDGQKTTGAYFVELPDGRLQRVDYFVDGYSGYVARVSYSGGKDDSGETQAAAAAATDAEK